MNKAYMDFMVEQAQCALIRSRAVRNLEHNGMTGELREWFIAELLGPMLPADFVAGSGKIVTAYGQTSRQTDIVLCDRRVCPPALFARATGVFPVEASIATIEVKSRLTWRELRGAQESARLLADYKHAPPIGQSSHDGASRIEHIIPMLFAFATDLDGGGKAELNRYERMLNGATPAIRTLCVVGSGCWWFGDQGWTSIVTDEEAQVVAAFVASVTNVCQRVAKTRHQPNLFQYMLPEQTPQPSTTEPR